MKKFTLLCLLVVITILASAQHLVLSMPSLQCGKTTEDGEDEVYQLIVFKRNNGVTGSIRVPGIPNAWKNMNDRNRLISDLDWGELLSFDLAPGESIDILGMIMEKDDGTLQAYSRFGPELLRTSFFSDLKTNLRPSPRMIQITLDKIKNSFSYSNADDWIGAYTCHFEAGSKGVVKSFGLVNNPNNDQGHWGPEVKGNVVKYNFTGDGSFYGAKLLVTEFRR